MSQYHGLTKPLISVIIPLYNKAPHIKRAIDSVLQQTFQDFELIIINDGSTDGSEHIVSEYNDSRIHLINQKNQGVSAARNNGVNHSKSDFVSFLDADDEWLPEFLETILKLREVYPNAGVYGTGCIYVGDNGESMSVCHPELGVRVLNSYYKEKNNHVGLMVYITAAAVDKRVFQSIGGFSEKMKRSEDEDFLARMAYVSDVVYNPKPLAKLYTNSVNKTTNIFEGMDSPFLEMVYIQNKNGKLQHPDLENLLFYSDRLRMGIALRYLYTDITKVYDHIKKMISHKYRLILSIIYWLVRLHIISPDTISSILGRRRRLNI